MGTSLLNRRLRRKSRDWGIESQHVTILCKPRFQWWSKTIRRTWPWSSVFWPRWSCYSLSRFSWSSRGTGNARTLRVLSERRARSRRAIINTCRRNPRMGPRRRIRRWWRTEWRNSTTGTPEQNWRRCRATWTIACSVTSGWTSIRNPSTRTSTENRLTPLTTDTAPLL